MFKLVAVFCCVVIACNASTAPTRYRLRNSYFVYTRNNSLCAFEIEATQASIRASPIDDSVGTVIIVHGHGGSAYTSLNPIVKDAILMANNLNVIVVDWSDYARLSYTIAAGVVEAVGNDLATFANTLITNTNIKSEEMHFVGFDLGAHVVGIAGRAMKAGWMRRTVSRITGLDPSRKEWGSNSNRLRVTDARYVEVIHTDGNGIFANGLGTPIGWVDFYANGGGNQPGCLTHSCSHNRAYELFAASMTNPRLVGYPCSSTTQLNLNLCRGEPLRMGTTNLHKTGLGVYRINTRRTYPF